MGGRGIPQVRGKRHGDTGKQLGQRRRNQLHPCLCIQRCVERQQSGGQYCVELAHLDSSVSTLFFAELCKRRVVAGRGPAADYQEQLRRDDPIVRLGLLFQASGALNGGKTPRPNKLELGVNENVLWRLHESDNLIY